MKCILTSLFNTFNISTFSWCFIVCKQNLVQNTLSPIFIVSIYLSCYQFPSPFVSWELDLDRLSSISWEFCLNLSYKSWIFYYTIIKRISMSKHSHKNYYAILGIPENASLFEIESAYQKLASKWHPDKNKEHRKSAEVRFQQIAQAYEVLSDRNKRANYDELMNREYSVEDANSTFQRFFNEHGFKSPDEEKFFNEHYPSSISNFYSILGLSREATIDQIKSAYRKLALQYHPKNNPNDQAAWKNFVAVNQAYNGLCDQYRRKNYDSLVFGTIQPIRAHNIFDDFFVNRPSLLEEDIFFKPLLQKRRSRDLDNLMINEEDEKLIKDGQTIKSSSVYTNKNGQESKKTVTTKRNFKGGNMNEERTEEYLFPNGERNVRRSITVNGKTETKEYKLKKGEDVPKELTL